LYPSSEEIAPMTCQSSNVPMTPMSAIQVATPTRRKRRHACGTRRPDRRSSTASATIAATTEMTPSTITASLRALGVVMNRVSTPILADRPGCAATLRSVKMPATCGFFSIARAPAAPGMPTKSAPTPSTSAQMCSTLQVPAVTAARGATAATESRNATTTTSEFARTNSPLLVASVASGGTVEKTRPPEAGIEAIALQGMETSSACGAPDTSGAVTSLIIPSGPGACGHRIVAVVCLTGSTGTSAHNSTPAMPETMATSLAMR
jgi:hypothetical protein